MDKPIRKILLIGSAGYIKEWYREKGRVYLDEGYKLAAMNNAWGVDPEHLTYWFRSQDYFLTPGGVKPSAAEREKWTEIVKVLDVPFFKVLDVPFFYSKGREGGTMLLNSICHFLNRCFYSNSSLWLVIAGSDLIYKNAPEDYFYGKGQPDPLMVMGKEMLLQELTTLKILAEQLGHKILNGGNQAETLLPFARFDLQKRGD